MDIAKGKAMMDGRQIFNNTENIMELVDKWCVSLVDLLDVFVYYAGHAINFEGSQWIVPASARLRERFPASFALQCVQLNWIRVRLAKQTPRVTIYAFDCCDTLDSIPLINNPPPHPPNDFRVELGLATTPTESDADGSLAESEVRWLKLTKASVVTRTGETKSRVTSSACRN